MNTQPKGSFNHKAPNIVDHAVKMVTSKDVKRTIKTQAEIKDFEDKLELKNWRGFKVKVRNMKHGTRAQQKSAENKKHKLKKILAEETLVRTIKTKKQDGPKTQKQLEKELLERKREMALRKAAK